MMNNVVRLLLALLTLFLSSAPSSAFVTVAPYLSVSQRVEQQQRPLSSLSRSEPVRTTTTTTTRLHMMFGPKDDGSPGDYVCKDCGYVFTKGPQAWAALPNDYSCPPCGAAKWRFSKVPKGSASGGKVTVKGKTGAQQPPANQKKGLFG